MSDLWGNERSRRYYFALLFDSSCTSRINFSNGNDPQSHHTNDHEMNEVMMMSIRVRVRESILLVFILFHGRDISCIYSVFRWTNCSVFGLLLSQIEILSPSSLIFLLRCVSSVTQFHFFLFHNSIFYRSTVHFLLINKGTRRQYFFFISAVSSISFRFLCSSPTTSSTYTHRCCSNIFTFGNTSEHNTQIESHSLIRSFWFV